MKGYIVKHPARWNIFRAVGNEEMKPLYIIGAGGFGREVAWLVERINAVSPAWNFKGFIDDNEVLWNTEVDGYKIHGGISILEQSKEDVWCVLAVGNAIVRCSGINRLQSFAHIHFATLIDPSVKMSSSVTIGEGSIICAGTSITVDVNIGIHNIINLDCTIGHDAILEDFVTLYPSANVSGCVKIGTTTEIGTGAQIIQGKVIGSNTIIGAGTVVIKDIPDDVTAVGNPAKVIKRHEDIDSPGSSGGILASQIR